MTPAALEQVVRTCLAKEPDDRFQNAHDVKLQLQWVAAGGSQAGAPAIATSRPQPTRKLLLATLAAGWLLAIAGAVLAILYAGRLTVAQRPVRASIEDPAAFDFAPVVDGAPVLSPDGQLMAFLARKKHSVRAAGGTGIGNVIVLRRMSTGEVGPIPGTDSAIFPFWSPDGQFLGFFAEGKLRKVPVAGGPPQVLCDAPDGRGGAWSQRGTIVFAPRITGPLEAVSDGGGTPVQITAENKQDSSFTNRNPYFLPDGQHFLFLQRGGRDSVGSVYIGSLAGGPPKQLLPAGSNVAYSDGYLFYLKDGTLTAAAFDANALELRGKALTIADGVEYYNSRDIGYFSVSGNVLVYRKAALENRELAWLDVAGRELDHWAEAAPYSAGTFSPGSQMAILYRANASGRGDSLWLADIRRKTVTRLTADSDLEQAGVVTADGNSVVISTTSGYTASLVQRWLTASGKEEKLADIPPEFLLVKSVSPDGRYIFLSNQDPKTSFDIYYMDLQAERKLVPLLTSPYGEFDARLSSNDKWLAYTSNETGRLELYVTSFPAAGSKWQVSNSGVSQNDVSSVMDWSPDGKHLYYQQGDKIYDVELHDNGGKPDFSAPREIASLPPSVLVISILPDGKQILVARPVGDNAAYPLELLLNWQQGFRQ
jgi:eukaryotic-like serine/threonine-protein kinase